MTQKQAFGLMNDATMLLWHKAKNEMMRQILRNKGNDAVTIYT